MRLWREAVGKGGTVGVLCAAETTVGATRALFETAADTSGTGARIDVCLVEGGLGRPSSPAIFALYHHVIAAAADRADEEPGVTCVALARSSMADAAGLTRSSTPPLTSPSGVGGGHRWGRSP